MQYPIQQEDTSTNLTVTSFMDYEWFEDDFIARQVTKQKFISDIINVPEYHYPKLDGLDTFGYLTRQKDQNSRELLALRTNQPTLEPVYLEQQMYIDFYENNLKKILLVEAARHMHQASSLSDNIVAQREFMSLCHEIYGDMNPVLFDGIMTTEELRVRTFVPRSTRSHSIKKYLDSYFAVHQYEEEEAQIITSKTLHRLGSLVNERYGEILSVVPPTNDEVVYDAIECQQIISKALERGRLTEKGWQVEIATEKSNPSTDTALRTLYLPADTVRTADQLRRLIIHEQEVHARRGQNGVDSGIQLLGIGAVGHAYAGEGLGVLLECAVAGNMENQSYYRARDRYLTAGIAIGLDGLPRDGRGTFDIVWRLLALRMARDGIINGPIEKQAKEIAMLYIENAFRGTSFDMPGVIYTKLKVYYEGLVRNAQYFEDTAADMSAALNSALIGKYDHTDWRAVMKIKAAIERKIREEPYLY
jgi:hypothetical protein